MIFMSFCFYYRTKSNLSCSLGSIGSIKFGNRTHRKVPVRLCSIAKPIEKQSNDWSPSDFSFRFVRLATPGYAEACLLIDRLTRGTLGGSEHRNTAKNIDKYRNIAKKITKYRNIAIRPIPCQKSRKNTETTTLFVKFRANIRLDFVFRMLRQVNIV